MKVCDLTSGVGQLSQAYADLKERWSETKTHWNDDTSRTFQQEHLSEIPTRLQQLFGAAQRLAEVLEKAERELSEQRDES